MQLIFGYGTLTCKRKKNVPLSFPLSTPNACSCSMEPGEWVRSPERSFHGFMSLFWLRSLYITMVQRSNRSTADATPNRLSISHSILNNTPRCYLFLAKNQVSHFEHVDHFTLGCKQPHVPNGVQGQKKVHLEMLSMNIKNRIRDKGQTWLSQTSSGNVLDYVDIALTLAKGLSIPIIQQYPKTVRFQNRYCVPSYI